MSYNVTKDLGNDNTSRNFMDVGIHENCELTRVEYNKTEKGNEFLAFYFVNPEGEELSHTEWKPRSESADRVENQIQRIKQLICGYRGDKTIYISRDSFVFKADDFEEFAKTTINLLGDSYKGKKVRVKVVYSDTGYTSLPQYWKFRFIESMDVLKENSKIKMMSIDKVTREPKPDVVETTLNPIEVKAKVNDDLPF